MFNCYCIVCSIVGVTEEEEESCYSSFFMSAYLPAAALPILGSRMEAKLPPGLEIL